MKKESILLVIGIMLILTSCNSRLKVFENPIFEVANTTSITISKVEVLDTATYVYFDVNSIPNNIIKISGDSYLRSGDSNIALKRALDIELDKEIWIQESEEISFVLKFGALPKDVKSFDFIGSDCVDCFKIYGVNLTGETEFPEYPEKLPDEFKKEANDGILPDPIFEVGNTKLNITLLGYRPELVKDLLFIENRLLTNSQEYNIEIDSDRGEATLTFEQYGTSNILLLANNYKDYTKLGEIWVAPGDTMDIYIDLQEAIFRKKVYDNYDDEFEHTKSVIYTNGFYSNLNKLYDLESSKMELFLFDFYNGEFVDYDATADEYYDFIESRFNQKKENIANAENCSQMIKELTLIELETQYFKAIQNSKFLLSHCYRKKNNEWDMSKKIKFQFATLKQEHTDKIKDVIDFNNPKYLMTTDESFLNDLLFGETKCEYILDNNDTFINEVIKGISYISKAENNELTDNDKKNLCNLKDPFFSIACNTIQENINRKLNDSESTICILETPNVENDKLFDEIISKHKGKLVIVDFWNTWCVPCREAITNYEKLKSSELNDNNIVWVYIANETSPLTAYKTFIADIDGEHYRLSEAQWNFIIEKLNIDAIPSYIIVDNYGNYNLRNDLRERSRFSNIVKAELDRCSFK